jgi:hypothetical protein
MPVTWKSKAAVGKLLLVAVSLLGTYVSTAQSTEKIRNGFTKLMQAYPGNFISISKGTYDSLWETYPCTVEIPGTMGNEIKRKHKTRERFFETLIDLPESGDSQRNIFEKWAAAISALTFNGASLKETVDPRYKTPLSGYIESRAWQLDGTKHKISADYREFTIRLEWISLDELGEVMRIRVGHWKIDPLH